MISGYRILERVHVGDRTDIYRAIELATDRQVTIKVPNAAYPSVELLWQLRHEYAIAQHLQHPQIIETYSLAANGDSYALVMEDYGAISLRQWLDRTPTASIATKVRIALDLATALVELSCQQIVHYDLNPNHILIHPHTYQIKLIDFGSATFLSTATSAIGSPPIVAAMLPYLAPERTGKMNSGIDYRSDLYSLGIILFELFAGKLPFLPQSPIEWLDFHLYQIPPQLTQIDPSIPQIIANIVAKLIAKSAEDRYQTAIGLKHDLDRYLQQDLAPSGINNFELGEYDLPDRFTIPSRLYGREIEFKTLLATFERVIGGGGEFVSVAGTSGIGKTALINELQLPMVRSGAYVIKGKFDRFNRDLPLSAFVSAFNDLISQIASESDDRLAEWRAKILLAVGSQGRLLIEVIPGLEKIIGTQPSVAELVGAAAKERFECLFQNFIAVFATTEHPLVICLDDLQWVDLASLELIKLLISSSRSLLLIGAYRDDEVSNSHPLAKTIDSLVATSKYIETIVVSPLNCEHINQLIANILRCSIERTQSLSQIIDRQTNGNPFFITQLLKSLHTDGAIWFAGANGWQWDLEAIELICSIENIDEFMAGQLQKLPQQTQSLLELAACIGNRFDLQTLAIVADRSPAQIDSDLNAVLQTGLIVPITQRYKFSLQSTDLQIPALDSIAGEYRFLHDRVQQAAYALIPTDRRHQTHLQIGRLLLANLPTTAKTKRLFEIVHHFNAAVAEITDPVECETIAQLNLDAALKAKAAIAYVAACTYASIGVDLLGESGWQHHQQLTLSLHETLAETAFLSGNFDRIEPIFTDICKHTTNPLDRVKIYQTQIKYQIVRKQYREAIEFGIEILRQLGIKLTDRPDRLTLIRELTQTKLALAGKTDRQLLDLPPITDRQQIAQFSILELLLMPAYFISPALMVNLATVGIRLTLQRGNTLWTATFFTGYALALASFGNLKQSYRLGKLAVALNDRFADLAVGAKVISTIALYCQPLIEAARQTIEPIDASIDMAIEGGNLTYMGISSHIAMLMRFYTGIALPEIISKIPEWVETIERSQDESIIYDLSSWHY
jgi:predicted ATPase